MTAVPVTDFYGAPAPAYQVPSSRWLRRAGSYTLLGIVLLAVNVPQYLYQVIDARVADADMRSGLKAPIQAIQAILSALIGSQPAGFFERAMTCCFLLLLVFLGLAAILSARRGDIRMLGYALGGMIVGYFALHVIAWVAVAVVVTFGAVFFLFGWVGSLIAAIVSFIASLWPLFVLAAIGWIAYVCFARSARVRWVLPWLRSQLSLHWKHLFAAGVASAFLALMVPTFYRWVLAPLWNFIVALLSPIVQAILFVLTWLIVILIVGMVTIVAALALALVGALFVTQLQATWHAARSAGLMLAAGFAIGSMVALIALISVATPALAASLNQAWANAWSAVGVGDGATTIVTDMFTAVMPGSVESFVSTHLTSQPAPAFDSLIFMAMMVLASISAGFRILEPRAVPDEAVPLTFIAKEYAQMMAGLFVGVIFILVSAAANDS